LFCYSWLQEPYSRIKKELLKEVKALKLGERVLLVGNSSEPWLAAKKDEKGFMGFWDKVVHAPLPDYASRRVSGQGQGPGLQLRRRACFAAATAAPAPAGGTACGQAAALAAAARSGASPPFQGSAVLPPGPAPGTFCGAC
jgi:hypothetical protein